MLRFAYEALPMRVVFGAGSLDALPAEVERLGCDKALTRPSGSGAPFYRVHHDFKLKPAATCSASAPSAVARASPRPRPAVTQPGKTGNPTPKSPAASSRTSAKSRNTAFALFRQNLYRTEMATAAPPIAVAPVRLA